MKKFIPILIMALFSMLSCTNNVKYIVLSFDDGVNTGNSDVLMDLLEEQGVKASFFVEGCNLSEKTITQLKRAVSLGIDIENHSFDHPYMSRISEAEIREQIEKTDALIEKYTGTKPMFFRPPYIDHNDLMHKVIDKTFIAGYSCHDWNPEISVEERVKLVMEHAEDGMIILLHDHEGKGYMTIEALKTIIPELKAQGYEFVTVPELFKLKGITPEPHSGNVWDCVR